ncbi:hypothetical protein [Pseudomonas brassicacearum]|nr:hypothetical protein [Pseudomonas brassicacearum]
MDVSDGKMTSQGKQVSGNVEAFDDLILGYVLKKLTEVFEELMAVSKNNHPDNLQGVVEMGRVKAAKNIPGWLQRVKHSTPSQVTRVMIEQMNDAQQRQQDLRVEAQVVLLELLVEASLAFDATRYSEGKNKSLH